MKLQKTWEGNLTNCQFISKVVKLTKPSSTSLEDDPAYFLQARKVNLLSSLGKKMALAGKAGTYNSWMFEES